MLLDKKKDNSDRKLLRFFLQGHLGANKNVALDVYKLLPIMLEKVEKIRSLSVIGYVPWFWWVLHKFLGWRVIRL